MERIRDLRNSARVMLPPFKPALGRVFFLVIGIILGILSVYMDLPLIGLEWRNADPVHLNEGDKDTWVKNAAIVYFQSDRSEAVAQQIKSDLERAGYGPTEIGELAAANQGTDVQAALLAVQNLPAQDVADDERGRISTGFVANIIFPILCLVIWAVVLILAGVVLSLYPIPIGPWKRKQDAAVAGLSEIQRARKKARDAAKGAAGLEMMDVEADLGEPLGNFMSAYVLGDDLYDDSFAIEPDGGYAGEAGIGILETIGIGDPKKVTAFSVEIFDQVEMQTKTLVLMSEHAYNDPSLRDKLTPRGEPALAKPGGSYWLETRHIKARIGIISMEYGEGAPPPNSFFQNLSLSLTVWLKNKGTEGTSPLSRISDFDMPPAQPMAPPSPYSPPPTSPQPLTGNLPPQQPGTPRPLTGNVPPGVPPMQLPPQQRPPTPPPGQQPPPAMPPGGARPLTGNMPPGGQQRPPMPPPGQQPPRPLPPSRPPQDDDPFGDTSNM